MQQTRFPKPVTPPFLEIQQHGFSLPELLVAGIIAALVAAATGQIMFGQILEGRRLEQAAKIRDNISRLNYLIQIEASEAEEILYGQSTSGCGESSPASDFTLLIPNPEGDYASLEDRTPIHYYNSGNDIIRCGPSVTRDGILVHPEPPADPVLESAVVVRDAQINVETGVTDCPASTERRVAYGLSFPRFPGVNPGPSGQCVVAHARSVFVCNPAGSAGSLGQGDCPPVVP